MLPFKVHILGCGSALPTPKHFASSQVVEIRGKMFLIDCGEGTQVQLRQSKINFSKISSVFISHLHGDHCFGVIGLISTFGMLGRVAPLHIYAHKDFERILLLEIEFFCSGLEYEVIFHEIDTSASSIIYEDRSLTVETIPLEHRVPCCGFLFKEKPTLPHIRRDMIDFYNIPLCYCNNIKNGEDFTLPDGKIIPSSSLTRPSDPPRKYAYCSDTAYIPTLHKLIDGADLLYHESTYCEDKLSHAKMYCHSTARQAAKVAHDANVKKLILGHYSARYSDEEEILKEAQEVFPNSFLTHELDVFDV
ncbi:MAG: ribonuclease Z [Prevotella sp.]|nr:ribonuclease Z [Prevotella sp.]